jgi:N-acetylmuramoyl-L-alanine amidase/type II secretory pathway predicted ATPase ExeA
MFLDFYGLREQPFGVTPDPAYLYPSQTHCEALDSLTEAILGDRGFLALIAEPGMGKTTLLYQLLEGLRETARAAFLFQTQCNSREFFQYLLSELGVDAANMGLVAMHNKLNEILFAEMLAGRRFVLIVDEAQNLDEVVLETIRLLSNFETPHSKLLQIVLAGQPQFGEKLRQKPMAQLLQRITLVQRLTAITPEETAGYVRHRLKVAGYRGEGLFEAEALARVAERSEGVPRNINKICFRALLEAYARGRNTVSAEIVEKAARKLEIVTADRHVTAPAPMLVAMPTPTQPAMAATIPAPAPMVAQVAAPIMISAPKDAAVVEHGTAAVVPGITYKQVAGWGVPRWGVWTGGVVGILLTASLAVPRNVLPGMVQAMRKEVAATKSLLAHKMGKEVKQTAGVQELAASGVSSGPRMSASGMPYVTAIQTSGTENAARVVVMLEDAVQYESARIGSPDRIYFDLYKAQLSPLVSQRTAPSEGGLLKLVRAAQNKDEVVRLVLDADGAKEYSAQLLTDPYRLVIDVHGQGGTAAKESAGLDAGLHNAAEVPPKGNGSQGSFHSLARELGLKINRIAIDPGHGGYDTGTKGPHGLLEKDLCLDVALRLGRLIEENIADTEVVYTRTDDRHVPLEERTAIANSANADLFISIHANSSESRETRGVETYYLSLTGSPESRELATRENATAESSLHELGELIKKITRNEKIAESRLLAADIQNTLSQGLQLVSRREMNRGVKQAPFVVLTGANMPAVLSEISFVSNASDEKLLQESAQRQRVAEGLYRGIAAYLESLHSLQPNQLKLVSESHGSRALGLATPAVAK